MKTEYKNIPILKIVGDRTIWLILFLGGLLFCASVMHKFETLLQQNLQLSFFVPLIIGHAGNSGGQTVTTIIRELGCNELKTKDVIHITIREAIVGFLQSIILIIIMIPYMFYMKISHHIAIIVFLTMIVMGVFSNACSSLIPFWITRWTDLDPAIIAAPFMTTIIDILGISVYLLIALECLNNHPEMLSNIQSMTYNLPIYQSV
jgi:Mg/Co/Ni transporter MgtE